MPSPLAISSISLSSYRPPFHKTAFSNTVPATKCTSGSWNIIDVTPSTSILPRFGFNIAATAAALYAFRAGLYAMVFAIGISASAAGRRAGVVLRISAATAAFTAFVYALGLLLARGYLPREALPTFYLAVSSAALLGAFVAIRGFTPAILPLTCLGFNGAVVVAMLKSVLLAPNALETAVNAFKALRGRLDLQGAAFAAVYMLRSIEMRYREIYTVSTMLAP